VAALLRPAATVAGIVTAPSTLRLQQFARLPRAGQVKTRLQAELTAEQACAVHCELLERVAGDLLAARLGPVELWLDESGEHPAIDRCLAAGLEGPYLQSEGDLGWRMEQALMAGLARAPAVLLAGSDCPGLDAQYLAQAAQALEQVDVVFGAAEDGGYVLLGARRMEAGLFRGVEWGSAQTLAQSEACVARRGFSSRRLALRYDVDTPEDLRRWRREHQAQAGEPVPR